MDRKAMSAAAALFAIIDELRETAEAAQEANRTYREYVRVQALRIEALEAELRAASAGNTTASTVIIQRTQVFS